MAHGATGSWGAKLKEHLGALEVRSEHSPMSFSRPLYNIDINSNRVFWEKRFPCNTIVEFMRKIHPAMQCSTPCMCAAVTSCQWEHRPALSENSMVFTAQPTHPFTTKLLLQTPPTWKEERLKKNLALLWDRPSGQTGRQTGRGLSHGLDQHLPPNLICLLSAPSSWPRPLQK